MSDKQDDLLETTEATDEHILLDSEEDDTDTDGNDYEYDEDDKARPKSNPKTIFIAAFCIALLLLAVAGLVWWISGSLASSDTPSSDTTPKTTPILNTQPTEPPSLALSTIDDRIAVAVYFADSDGTLQSVTLTMIHADTANEKITTLGLPPETIVDKDNDLTLGALYDDSIEAAQDALNAYVSKTQGIDAVKYYMIFTYDGIESVIDEVKKSGDSFFFTFDTELREQFDDGSDSIYFPAGKQSLTAAQVADLFRYTAWVGGSSERAQKHAEIVTSFLNQMITGASKAELSSCHTLLYYRCLDTDFTADAYEASAAVFKDIAGYKGGVLCVTPNTDGTFSQSATRFELSKSTVELIQANTIQ